MSENGSLSKSYDAKKVEAYWYDKWQDAGLFSPSSKDSLPAKNPPKTPYVMMMPPPNVTGVLHNGHALFVTLEDILARYHRMQGKNVLWLPGTDHAGIATQAVVERELLRSGGKNKNDLGREKFIEKVWEWKEKNGSRIIEQLKMLGASADWSRCRFTMDESYSKAVKEAFVRMWNDGLIYRGERLVNWDPKTHTVLSDEEVDHETRKGELYSFAYKFRDDPESEIAVATTRLETMLGDTAVAVNPNDDRYTKIIGKNLVHPFFKGRSISVIADDYVDMEFGTGAVKITPAHDPNDFLMGKRHNLQIINIFTTEAKLNENGGDYAGFDRFEARKKVKQDLEELGLFRGAQVIEHAVSISPRSHVDIEPMLSRQYFVDAKPLAKMAVNAVDSGETRIIPKSFEKTWNHFLLNIQDWCVSRQLWWGHQIPVFYNLEKMREVILEDANKKGYQTPAAKALQENIKTEKVLKIALVDLDDDSVRSFSEASTKDLSEGGKSQKYYQEQDVLDTWFSSGLWPFSTLGWPNKTDDLKAFYPGVVLETGFDILFFWVARMMMLGIYFMGEAPFKDVFLHSMMRDSHGKKMSKSLGNTVDPADVIFGITLDDLLAKIKTYPVPQKLLPKVIEGTKKDYPHGIPASGADGLRLSLVILSGQGQNVRLSIPRVEGYRSFLNKIWNATRFALMRVDTRLVKPIEEFKNNLSLQDKWILSRIQVLSQNVQYAIGSYKFSEAANSIYQFFWTEFCDWYLEFAKISLNDEAAQDERGRTASVIVEVLDVSCRLLHPFCPYISEEIWQKLPLNSKKWQDIGVKFCAVAPFPKAIKGLIDEQAESQIGLVQKAIGMIRNAKQESNLPAQKRVAAIILVESYENVKLLNQFEGPIKKLAFLGAIKVGLRSKLETPENSTINSASEFDAVVLLEGLIDKKAEKARLEKELSKTQKEMALLSDRLNSECFIKRAPPEVVTQSQVQLKALEKVTARINEALVRV